MQTLRLIARDFPGVTAAQVNFVYVGAQVQQPARQDPPAGDASAQYVVRKLHLLEAHRVNKGDDVLVAVIDSKIDNDHPDLAGAIAGEFDAVGTPTTPHAHGTAIAGAIAANSKLVGVAPKVRLLGRTGLFRSRGKRAEHDLQYPQGHRLGGGQKRAHHQYEFRWPRRSDVAGDARQGRRRAGSCWLQPSAMPGRIRRRFTPVQTHGVIGVTATDANDKLMPQANRGPQVAVAAPGVEILAAAPDGKYQVTSGTSVAAAHVSGVAALLLATKPKLTPAQVRGNLVRSAHRIPGTRNEVGAGVVDALAVVNPGSK